MTLLPASRVGAAPRISLVFFCCYQSCLAGSLFANATYEKDDEEADKIWESVDKKLEEKRKRHRERKEQEEREKQRKIRPKIADQFADLKQELATVKAEEWDAIPEASTGVRTRRRIETYTHVTDSMITSSRALQGKALHSAYEQPGKVSDPRSTTLSAARDQVLRLNLDKMSDSVSGQTVVDPKGYMTQLDSQKISSTSEISDIKKARLLYKSVTSTNPKHAPGWIAAARLEEVAGKLLQARIIIQKGKFFPVLHQDARSTVHNNRLRSMPRERGRLARGSSIADAW